MTPGCTVPPVGFVVAARGGLGVRSEGAGVRSPSGNLGARSAVRTAWARDGERGEMVWWAGPTGRWCGLGPAPVRVGLHC
jgi:hypothetical protein